MNSLSRVDAWASMIIAITLVVAFRLGFLDFQTALLFMVGLIAILVTLIGRRHW